jgi:UDP-N-acetyl-D-glucosamine dehydrogenase
MAGNNKRLLKKIDQRSARVGIIGMGYVGSALSELVVKAGYDTVGFVRRIAKADRIDQQGIKNLKGSIDTSLLRTCDIILICVQTPIHEDKTPDLSFIEAAVQEIADNIGKDQLIVIESSYAPGTTRNIALPILEKTGRQVGSDFYLSFSPERVDPGNIHFSLNQIPKVVSGIDQPSLEVATAFYASIIDQVVPVSSMETAELVKIFENTYRLVNISLVNEVTEYAKAVGLDMWEVIAAASTKPFGFMPHYPGPGIGGHCIPVDPFYLVDQAKSMGIKLDLVEAAGKVNDAKPERVVEQTVEIIERYNGQRTDHKVLLVGLAYKADIDDTRESPALKIWRLFEEKNIGVSFHDPYVSEMNGAKSVELSAENIRDMDAIVITTNHTNIEYQKLAEMEKPVIDTRNVYKGSKNPRIFRI